jgi:hypothetical protein
LITGSNDKHVKRISIVNREVEKDFGQVGNDCIMVIKVTADDEKLFVGDIRRYLQLISSRDGELIKDFGQVHNDVISRIIITLDQKFFFHLRLMKD